MLGMHISPSTKSATPEVSSEPAVLASNLSVRDYTARFSALPAPSEALLQGRFRAQFVGPAWLRLTAGPSVALAGLRNWWGKELSGFGRAHNLVLGKGRLVATLPMQLALGTSRVDGKICAVLRYGPESPFPWPHVTDELRALSDRELLGMSVIDAPLLRSHAFPFLLVREA